MEDLLQVLVDMGFSETLASQALVASGGDVVKATDLLLNPHSNRPPPAAIHLTIQPKINRFFLPNPRNDQKPPKPHRKYEKFDKAQHFPSLFHRNKRPKLQENQVPIQKPYREARAPPHAPLSERMRPRVLNEVVGQEHLLASDSLLRSAISCGRLPSVVLWGPPGSGKTCIARAIASSCAESSSYRFVSLSAVSCGVKDVREAVEASRNSNKKSVVFVDEVHRFNKAQQDSFLPMIDEGRMVLVGATTENPSFHLITPLLSRCRVLTLNPLKPHDVAKLVKRAVSDVDRGLAAAVGVGGVKLGLGFRFEVNEDAIDFLSLHCDGDARVALNALEIAATTALAIGIKSEESKDSESARIFITAKHVKDALQHKHLAYDRAGEEHYNLISALYKSMRGSNADAAIYWLARMLEGGEEPLYIARCLVRFASEDVGLAEAEALSQAVSCYHACHFLGMPECSVILAHSVAYLSLAAKSVAVSRAIASAREAVKKCAGQNEGVPLHLRNAPTKLMKDLGYGSGYLYPPDNPHSSSSQPYLPPSLEAHKFLHWP